ncbi:Leucine-rich repeat-containing protein 59 [Eufriesea mexicana]|uniref:leucine-rich repeat-containing protein 59-like n=1 Tax=Eufriesea mexicana TaxID=516756 RepID=UPI00083C3BDD|nr:PREDICTED: leucine-rich repeat-containing protein 59-like [Eufriesea mexicana]OAD59582.1 Leucine-rich repeat-containing protein 59 [Eufriesea mexicana]
MNLKNVKNRLKDETLDLSLCELREVPIREIVAIKKATHLDLSNNLLTSLPSTFIDIKQIVKLDLSRNMLTEIPENFGELRQLKYLDLYANQISRLPLSLSELKNLKWLDLKENPLTSAVASVAGPCSNLSECQTCARNIVTYLSRIKLVIEEEKLRRLNAITVDTETDNVLTKKVVKKKKKKLLDKNNKQNFDENGSNLSVKVSQVGESKVKAETVTQDKIQANKDHEVKENLCRYFISMISWLFLFGLTFIPMIVILPLYSKRTELFIDYIEANTGIRLKAFQKYGVNLLYSFMQVVINIYGDLYYAYEKNFKTESDIPVKK